MGLGSLIKNAMSGAGGGLLNGVRGFVQDLTIDPDKKQEALLKLKELELNHEKSMAELELKVEELAQKAQEEVSKRHSTDMNSDSWLSKNIRPMTMIFLTLSITTICILDASMGTFTVEDGWLEILKYSYMAVLSFYFIGRDVIKWGQGKNKKA